MQRIGLHEFGERYSKNLKEAPFIITTSGKPTYLVLPYTEELERVYTGKESEEGGEDRILQLTKEAKTFLKVVLFVVLIAVLGAIGWTLNKSFNGLSERVAVLEQHFPYPVTPTVPVVEATPTASPSPTLKPVLKVKTTPEAVPTVE